MKIAFREELHLNGSNKVKLIKINDVIENYSKQGYRLTLRQLYYQLVTENIISNNEKEYDKLSSLLTKGRMAGLIDWDAIEDRIRVPRLTFSAGDSPEDAINDAIENYRLDRMQDQENYVEMWVEKDALSNVLSRRTHHYHIRLMVNRGYSSTTAMFDAYNRIKDAISLGKKVTVLYLGDHDPSGLDMVRDIFDRLFLMLCEQPTSEMLWGVQGADEDALYDEWGYDPHAVDEKTGYFSVAKAYILEHFKIQHIALTTPQVMQYTPPPNPAKMADPRAEWYVEKFGRTSWEVDALNPVTLHQIIDGEMDKLIDKVKFEAHLKREEEHKVELAKLPTFKAKIGALESIMETVLPKKPTIKQLKKIIEDMKGAYAK